MRPGVAGAVLKTPLSVINLITDLSHVFDKYPPHVTCVTTKQNSWACNSPLKIALNQCPQMRKMHKQTIKQSFSGASFVQRTELFQSLSRKKTELGQCVSLQAA